MTKIILTPIKECRGCGKEYSETNLKNGLCDSCQPDGPDGPDEPEPESEPDQNDSDD